MEYFLADGMTIMSGGIAERVSFSGHGICRHYIYSFDLLYHGFVVLGAGFIGEFNKTSFFAYAGIDIVHTWRYWGPPWRSHCRAA